MLNRTWALHFMTETLYEGRRVRLLTMIDEGNREGLEIAMGLSLPSRRVVRVLDELIAVRGCPSGVRVDNGCGGRLRLIALIEEAAVNGRILPHLGVPTEISSPRPARSPPHTAAVPDVVVGTTTARCSTRVPDVPE